ncbi:Gfo/Idh/MocA family oxidoreductase [Algoriphagus halophytocola]|uniref:Gfo/Idh/MocA family oxidoreductase n=1 Tax=Algoriphagus halophytocola TaxID=2991499 RepID=A0ABY6ML71_9BACT|nr:MULTISPECIES: Gfo/Idh/MocA family oxidoreductase [unclassified Algoriphagus]UZD24515.1 Gfo/Idh/MocA family oxidoreductase [Algoriphagus sp. TR-M5]WBL41879.1 Gfo/Idh/MocA family oxidoreductase [Algoriphagus sp. TR-M9]
MRKIGIVGGGSIALTHAKVISELENAELVGVCIHSKEKIEESKAKFGVPVYVHLQEFLEIPGLEVVCICTPSGLHLEPALAAAKAGKHVMVEKPIEITLSRVDEMVRACEDAQVKLAVIFQNRFSDDYRKLKQGIDSGVFGKLIMGNAHINWFRNAEYYSSSKWKGTLEGDGGGALINQGIHTIDLLLDAMGEVKTVFGQVQTALYPIEGEDLGAALVNFESGALGNITAATSLYPGYPERLEIFGSKGSAILEGGKLIAWNVMGEENAELSAAASASGSSDPSAIGHKLHLAQWERFLKSLDHDAAVVVDAKTARKSVELIRAIYKSSELGQQVVFPFADL